MDAAAPAPAPGPSFSGAGSSAHTAQPSTAGAQQPPVEPQAHVPVPVQGAGAGSGSGVARACRHHAYSRKQKSLGLLCSNFVALYDREDVEVIGLDDAAKRLGVERRRIYDIVNVLESVGILVRRAKNRYTWLGFGGVPAALKELKKSKAGDIPAPEQATPRTRLALAREAAVRARLQAEEAQLRASEAMEAAKVAARAANKELPAEPVPIEFQLPAPATPSGPSTRRRLLLGAAEPVPEGELQVVEAVPKKVTPIRKKVSSKMKKK